jgi:hypothetical protein
LPLAIVAATTFGIRCKNAVDASKVGIFRPIVGVLTKVANENEDLEGATKSESEERID